MKDELTGEYRRQNSEFRRGFESPSKTWELEVFQSVKAVESPCDSCILTPDSFSMRLFLGQPI